MYQYVLKTFKDPMHAFDHGVAIYIIQAIIKTLNRLEAAIGQAKNTLVQKLTGYIHGLCNTLEVKHTTLMSFVHQSIVQCFENYSRNKKDDSSCPIVDATDVQRLMLTLPFLLDGLAVDEVEAFNAGKPQDQHVTNPLPDVIEAVNAWLHWYHLYRQQESDGTAACPALKKWARNCSTLCKLFSHSQSNWLGNLMPRPGRCGAMRRCTPSCTDPVISAELGGARTSHAR